MCFLLSPAVFVIYVLASFSVCLVNSICLLAVALYFLSSFRPFCVIAVYFLPFLVIFHDHPTEFLWFLIISRYPSIYFVVFAVIVAATPQRFLSFAFIIPAVSGYSLYSVLVISICPFHLFLVVCVYVCPWESEATRKNQSNQERTIISRKLPERITGNSILDDLQG